MTLHFIASDEKIGTADDFFYAMEESTEIILEVGSKHSHVHKSFKKCCIIELHVVRNVKEMTFLNVRLTTQYVDWLIC